jgi:hypothetical protein
MPNRNLNIPELSPEDKAVKEVIESKVSAFQDQRRAALLEIKANIAYLCGFQNIQAANNAIEPLPDGQATPVVANKILPAVINDMAVATHNKPTFDVIPASTTQPDQATAKACQKLIPYLQQVNGQDLGRAACVLWYDLAGVAWRKVYYDPHYAVDGINPGPEHEAHNPEIEPHTPIFRGEVLVEHVPNTELIYDTRAKNLDRLQWIIHAKTITFAEVKQRFGQEFADTVSPTEVADRFGGVSAFETEVLGSFNQLSNALVASQSKDNTQQIIRDDKVVRYFEFWHVPCVAWPQGAYAVQVGDRIAVNEPYPIQQYRHGELPFVPTAPITLYGIAGRAVSRISQARPLQREYNLLRSMILDNVSTMGNSIFMAPRNAKINFKRLDNQAGNIVEYEGLQRPSREAGVPVPGSIFAYIQEVKQSIDDTFSFPEPSRGVAPGRVESGKGIQLLQDAANMQLGPIVDGFDKSDERVVRQMLGLAITFYGNRLINFIGGDNAWTLYHLNPDDLNGKFRVIVRTGSSMPTNKALEAEKTFGLWQSGLLGDPMGHDTRQYVLKHMDLGNIDNFLQQAARHVNFAQREFLAAVELLAQMPPLDPALSPEEAMVIIQEFLFVPEPNSFDDHSCHIQEHTDFILENYWEYVSSGDIAKQILMQAMVEHANMHHTIISESQAQQLAQQIQGEAFTKGNTEQQLAIKHIIPAEIRAEQPTPKSS